MPVATHVLQHAVDRPRHLAVRGPGGDLTYADLARRTGGAARHLASRAPGSGPGSGMVIAISLADPVAVLVAVLAADLVGATPLVCDPTWDDAQRAHVLATVPVGAHVDTPLPYMEGPPPSVRALPGDLAWACFSSGSTGRPRAVVRTRASWTASFPHLNGIAGLGPDDAVLIPGPLVSSLYGFAAVHTLATGATAILPGGWSPASLAADLARATAVHVVPHRLPAVLEAARHAGGPLRTAVVGGASLPAESRALAAAQGVRVAAYYGATELSFVAVDADGCGLRPFPGVEIEVRVAPGEELGEVWVRSPWVAEGYLAGAAGPLRTGGDGWMSVGDVAEPYRTGEALRLRGRGGGAVQVGGATVVPEDVEETLRKVPGVADIVVLGSPHPQLGAVVTAVVEADGGRRPSRGALEAVARSGLDPAQRPRRWYVVSSLPRSATGKPARGLLAARLNSGDPEIRRLL